MSETQSLRGAPYSVQERRPRQSSSLLLGMDQTSVFLLQIRAALSNCPVYWSRARDRWLVDFVKQEGNDILAGAVSTVTAKIVATSWYVEGPARLVELSRRMLLHMSDWGRGWDSLCVKWVQGYLSRDGGGIIEQLRSSAADHTGPAMGFAHLDESRCALTDDPEYPVVYHNQVTGPKKMHASQVARIVDMENPERKYRGAGFCAVSRSLATASILMDVVRYKRERLSDLPAAGLLLINNLSAPQWTDLTNKYDARQHNEGNSVWRDLMVALAIDPAYPITAELIAFSELPEHYDERTATEMAVYTFALAFREDPREFWPVSSGPLGTATEAEIQARKARGKGEGIIYTAIEHQLNRPEGLPPGVTFRFDFQEDEEDKLRAEINNVKSQWIRRLWEASPNRVTEEGELGGEGMINTEQAQQLLVREGVVPADIMGVETEVERLYDTRAHGRRVRLYRDGRRLWL